MAAENKQQSASDTQTSPTVKVGGAQPARKLKLPRLNRKTFLYIGIAIVLVVAGALIAKEVLHVGEKVYAEAAGHKIYKEDVDELIGNTKGVSDRDAATVLANKYLTEAMAEQADVKVTDKDVEAQYGKDVVQQKNKNRYLYQVDVNNVYFNKLMAYNEGLYQGKLLVANFSRYIAFQSPFLDIQKATSPRIGNQAAIEADKKYALDFITKLYNEVKSGKITFDQAIQKEHDDPVLGKNVYQTLAHSGPFDTSNVYLGATALVAPKAIKSQIKDMKAGELSEPFPVSVANSLTDRSATTESYYLVVRMDSTSGGNSGLSYDQYLAKSKKELGYKVYV